MTQCGHRSVLDKSRSINFFLINFEYIADISERLINYGDKGMALCSLKKYHIDGIFILPAGRRFMKIKTVSRRS